LAGPVVAAAVVLPEHFTHPVLDDSKRLSPRNREQLHRELTGSTMTAWSVGVASVAEIDSLDILRATWLAMGRALSGLAVLPDIALIDGLEAQGLPVEQFSLVRADALSFSVAAASVIAKVERDRLMAAYSAEFPAYGFERHKGYATKEHLERLRKHGPCPIHRRTFQPVAQLAFDFGG
jgi:ribonuclease HII